MQESLDLMKEVMLAHRRLVWSAVNQKDSLPKEFDTLHLGGAARFLEESVIPANETYMKVLYGTGDSRVEFPFEGELKVTTDRDVVSLVWLQTKLAEAIKNNCPLECKPFLEELA